MNKDSLNIDISIVELFLIELESHTRTLERGLIGLENNNSVQIYESLMRAAHSIKGAAKISGIEKAVELAHEMENIFEDSRKNGSKINENKIQILLECNDFYISLLKYESKEIFDIVEKESSKINSLIKKLKSNDFAPNGTSKKIEEKSLEVVKSNNSEKNIDIKRSNKNHLIDDTFLELFKSEIFRNAENLKKIFKDAGNSLSPKLAEEIKRCIQSIKGTSKIVGIEEFIIISSEIESALDYFLNNENKKFNFKGIVDALEVILTMPDAGSSEVLEYVTSIDILDLITKIQSARKTGDEIIVNNADEINLNSPDTKKSEIVDNSETNSYTETLIKTENISFEAKEERFVRVMSDNLNKLLGLTGEILVQTKSLKPFSKDLQKLKIGLLNLNSLKEKIYHELFREGISEEINNKFNDSTQQLDSILTSVLGLIENFENFARRLEMTSDRLYNEAVETRMKPFSEGVYGFPRLVRDLSKELNKKVEFIIKGESTRIDRDILEKLEAPLNHLIRNAIDHGMENAEDRRIANKNETGKLILEARHSSGMLIITLSDDGRGINLDSLRKTIVERGFSTHEMAAELSPAELYDFLFLPGFSTRSNVTEISGRGVGLDVVFSMVNEVGGLIKVESEFGKGTVFQLQLPLTLSVIRTMLVEVAGEPYAIPLSRIDRVLSINFNQIKSVENTQYFEYNNENIALVDACQIFGLNKIINKNSKYHVVILSDRLNRYGLAVDRLVSQPDLVVLTLDKKLGKIPNISAGAVLEDGTPVLIIDTEDIVRSIDRITKEGAISRVAYSGAETKKKNLHILVVDDSLTVREVERKLLENKGYNVSVAVDGIDGWNTLHREKFDLIVSDIDMPRMNGIEMVKRIKSDPKYREIPVMIVSYKDREDDRKKGLEAGANYYLTKSSFHDDTLLEAVYDLIGKP